MDTDHTNILSLTYTLLYVYMCVYSVCRYPRMDVYFLWGSAEWLFRVHDYCWPVRRAEDKFLWVQAGCVCVCVCYDCVCCGSSFSVLLLCVSKLCVGVKYRTVFSLHGPYPVKEVFAVTGKTCRRLDSVAKEDLECSERRSEGKITHQIWMWSWKGRERLSWKKRRKEEWEAERRWGG